MKFTLNILILIIIYNINTFSTEKDSLPVLKFDSTFYSQIDLLFKGSFNNYSKVSLGDDINKSKPDYDDSDWKVIDGVYVKLDSVNNEKIAWFRYKFRIDSSLINNIVGLNVYQNCASEFYLNGNLIRKYGVVSKDIENEILFNPGGESLILHFDSSDVYTLAVRISFNKLLEHHFYFPNMVRNAYVFIKAAPVETSLGLRSFVIEMNTPIQRTLFGFLTAIALIHLFIFLFYRTEKENLYYSFYCLSVALLFLFSYLIVINQNPTLNPFFNIVNTFSIPATLTFFLLFIYQLYYNKIIKIIYIYYTLIILLILTLMIPGLYTYSGYIFAAVVIIPTIEGLRMTYLLIKRRREGFLFQGIGILGFLIITMFFLLSNIFEGFQKLDIKIVLTIMYIGFTSFPIAMSVSLGRKISQTNKRLSEKLTEVEELSAKTIEHERKEAEILIQREKEKTLLIESELRAKTAELQAKAIQQDNERKTKELEAARALQLSMLPSEIPQIEGWDIAVYMKTSTEVGGDYYDFHLDNNVLTTTIGDATGHGVKSGIMVTAVKSLFLTKAGSNDLVSIMEEANSVLRKMNLGQLYMCLSLLRIENNKLLYTNAGMPLVLIHRKETNKIEELDVKAMPLNAFDNTKFNLISSEINSGDTILLYSDGFPELFNEKKEMLDYPAVKNVFVNSVHLESKLIIKEFENEMLKWINNSPPQDDVTFVVLKKVK